MENLVSRPLLGSMSAIIRPIGAVMGAALVMLMAIIPYALAFAAGAMILVTN